MVPWGRVFGWSAAGCRLGGGHHWEHREAFCVRLRGSSVGKGLLYSSPQADPMKEKSLNELPATISRSRTRLAAGLESYSQTF